MRKDIKVLTQLARTAGSKALKNGFRDAEVALAQVRTVRASSKCAYRRVTSAQQPPRGRPSPSGKGRGCYERLRAAPRTTPSRSTPSDTDDGTRHEADRQADVASERDDEQRDRCDNEPLLCIRHRSHLIN
jgi:hypothetical protein